MYENIAGNWTSIKNDAYEKTVTGDNWIQSGPPIIGEAAGDLCGWSVSLSGDGTMLAVGSPYNDKNNQDSGIVHIYDLSALSNTEHITASDNK